ncbi:DUF2786 domain-containing protein [Ornithinimicrobium murale]|uniref:DUF2786 domain-containing protein n=1 Tax=Ornithinimicrobium murale TaxID=1050153 RepID=UPI000E0DD35E|nr:DUF2786 domain-containing protein [Ornithinimicrobium murale]
MATDKQTLIARLLAKAESTTPHEAEALTAAAEKLMIRHSITQAEIDARRAKDSEPEQVVTAAVAFTGTYTLGLWSMGWHVVHAFGTMRTFQRRRGNERKLMIVGFESDVSQAKLLVESLHLQAIVAMRAWWKTYDEKDWLTAHESMMARRQFIESFGVGAGERIRSMQATQVAEQSDPDNTALVLLDRRAKVEDQTAEFFGKLPKGRSWQGSWHGQDEGLAAGRIANTGGKTITDESAVRAIG